MSIVVTGAAGFIGSNLITNLNKEGIADLIIVDDFSKEEKSPNLVGKKFRVQIEREIFPDWLRENGSSVGFVFHIGARTNTAEFNPEVFDELNLGYSMKLWEACTKCQIPMVYASSAATYGMGELGYEDCHEIIGSLKPLNPYGESKNEFDKWVLNQAKTPPGWWGFKFFNVYGPNEYHKGRMASVIFHACNQIRQTGGMKLFKSHQEGIADGWQQRDFVYVKDVVEALFFVMQHRPPSAIYNLGTGVARSFFDLAANTFRSLGIAENISYIDTPVDIRDKYQYYTCATMEKLRQAGYKKAFYTLEEGINEYVKDYILKGEYC